MTPRKASLITHVYGGQELAPRRPRKITLRPSITTRAPPGALPLNPPPSLRQRVWCDRLLVTTFALVGLIIAYQVAVTLLHPSWGGPVTDWLRGVLAWPEFLIVLGVTIALTRAHRPGVLAWWMWSAALLSYTIARTLWTIDDQIIYQHHVPFPIFTDVFFVLQYPFFFLAVLLLPRGRSWEGRLFMAIDGLLVMGAAIALSWNFILAPIYTASGISPIARSVSLAYPVGDLFVLCGLTLALLRPSRYPADRLVLAVLVVAVVSLITADSWVNMILLSPPHVYPAGNPPDLFWLSFYLLVPLASIVQLRLARRPQDTGRMAGSVLNLQRIERQDFIASLRVFVPIVLALLAGAVLLMHATASTLQEGWQHEIASYLMCFGLLLLVVVRQEMVFLENAQLHREQAITRANEQALRELNRRKDEFLAVVSHELKTPLTNLQGYVELLARRFKKWQDEGVSEPGSVFVMARTVIAYCEDSLHRMTRLIDDLLDNARIREGRLAFNLASCDLSTIVRTAVDEQRLLAPERPVHLQLPIPPEVPVIADALRIEQVVSNFLTNAIKYSQEGDPVVVRVQIEGEMARVSVRDEGIGVPLQEQPHVWERFHRVEGACVQSGSGVSIGIGLSICKTIVEGHGGSVGLESEVGHGSTFWFTLPLARIGEQVA